VGLIVGCIDEVWKWSLVNSKNRRCRLSACCPLGIVCDIQYFDYDHLRDRYCSRFDPVAVAEHIAFACYCTVAMTGVVVVVVVAGHCCAVFDAVDALRPVVGIVTSSSLPACCFVFAWLFVDRSGVFPRHCLT